MLMRRGVKYKKEAATKTPRQFFLTINPLKLKRI
jgi:hypothetical protein